LVAMETSKLCPDQGDKFTVVKTRLKAVYSNKTCIFAIFNENLVGCYGNV